MQLTIELPPREQQLEFNRIRWSEIIADQSLGQLPYRFQTNAYGQITMTPPASGEHSTRQLRIIIQLDRLLGGLPLPECPISTLDGVKVADVGWYSNERFETVIGQPAFETAPEICVEVLSPGNTEAEMRFKRQLYFDAGANEVWICKLDGLMEFYYAAKPNTAHLNSQMIVAFPTMFDYQQSFKSK